MFFWKKWTERKAAGRSALVRARITETKRRSFRAVVEFPIAYAVEGRAGVRTAQANDLSAGGVRIVGDEDFPEHTVLQLRFTLPNELIASVFVEKEVATPGRSGETGKKIMVPPEPFAEMSARGRVLGAFLNLRRKKFAHGVEFIDIAEETREEIQRFIHIWQLRLIRERAHTRGE